MLQLFIILNLNCYKMPRPLPITSQEIDTAMQDYIDHGEEYAKLHHARVMQRHAGGIRECIRILHPDVYLKQTTPRSLSRQRYYFSKRKK